MPFWQQSQCCAHCRHFRSGDPSDMAGMCHWRPDRPPPWAEMNANAGPHPTEAMSGKDCPAYRHDAHKSHPLDRARAYLAQAQVGDKITVRTYDIGEVSRIEAQVLKHTPRFVVVRMLNDHRRIRLDATSNNLRAGTVVGLEDWGVDLQAPIRRGKVDMQHPQRAEAMLANLRHGDRVPVIGYPPFDGQRKQLYISSVTKNFLYLGYGRRKLRMHRAGPLAGIIEGEVWALDTSEETQNAILSEPLGPAA